MKKEFSRKWRASKQPRKQRKYLANAPLHLKRKFMAAMVDENIRKKYSIKRIEVRKRDVVKIMRGKFRKKHGKIDKVETRKRRISIEGITSTKKDGSKVPVWFNPSKVMIIELESSDRRRMKRIKKEIEKTKPEKKEGIEEIEGSKGKTEKTGEKDAHKKK